MQLKSRFIALPLAAVLASGAFVSTPAQASPKSKNYKTGAIVLGALGGYLLSKGKTVEGAAVLGGGYLAYKKGQKEARNERYGSNYGQGRYNNDSSPYYNGNASYPDPNYNNGSYNNGNYGNGGYSNGNYGSNGSYNNGNYGNNGSYNNGGYTYGDSSNGSYNNGDRECDDDTSYQKHSKGHKKNKRGNGNYRGFDNGWNR